MLADVPVVMLGEPAELAVAALPAVDVSSPVPRKSSAVVRALWRVKALESVSADGAVASR